MSCECFKDRLFTVFGFLLRFVLFLFYFMSMLTALTLLLRVYLFNLLIDSIYDYGDYSLFRNI